MCQILKQLWEEMLAVTRIWSIRKQMLLCYVVTQLIFLSFILFLVIVNLYLLRNETV